MPTANANSDLSFESWPSDGPTVRVSMMLTLTGNLDRQCARAQDDGEVLRLVERFLTADFGFAAENRLADIRRRQHFAVKQDCNRAADVLRREVGEFLRAFIREFEVDDVLAVLLIRCGLRVLEVGTGEHRVAFLVLEFEHGRLADGLDGRIRVLDARQLDDDAALAFALDDRLREAERVDALFHDRDDAVHGIVIDLRDVSVLRFKHDMRAALQVEALPDGIRQRLHEREEDADNRHDTDDEFQETVFSQPFSEVKITPISHLTTSFSA